MKKVHILLFAAMILMACNMAESAAAVTEGKVSEKVGTVSRGVCLTKNELCPNGGCCPGLNCKCTKKLFGGCVKWKCK